MATGVGSIAIGSSTSSFVLSLFIQLITVSPRRLTIDLLSGLVEGHDHTHTGGYGSVEHTIQLREDDRTFPHRYVATV